MAKVTNESSTNITYEITNNADYSHMIVAILNNIEVAIVGVNREGLIFYANERYGEHIGKSLKHILGKRLQDIYEGSTTITALKTGKKVVIERKVCPVDNSRFVTGIACPIFIGKVLSGAFSLYMDLPAEGVKLEDSTQTFFTNFVRQKLFGSMKELEEYNIIGQSASFLHTIEKASIIAETDVPVMIRGESGIGKEIVAKYIHNKSQRRNKPFIVINCAAIPENLVESELFGYEGGSFTGAKVGGKIGKFELANGGTLFLDEIGDMPLIMQPKLLRAIQENEIEKVGSEKTISVDVRIISATNQHLEKMISDKKFREDLYNNKYNKNIHLSNKAVSELYNYSWPGNIRELRNCLENVVIMCENELCTESTILNFLNQNLDEEVKVIIPVEYSPKHLNQIVADAEKNALIETLELCNNNKTKAMKILGLSRKTFYRKMNEYNLL